MLIKIIPLLEKIKDMKILTHREASKIIGRERHTAAKYRQLGLIRYHKLGREFYYFKSELLEDLKKLKNNEQSV
jgi:predicted site-specific integrase-resolvase